MLLHYSYLLKNKKKRIQFKKKNYLFMCIEYKYINKRKKKQFFFAFLLYFFLRNDEKNINFICFIYYCCVFFVGATT